LEANQGKLVVMKFYAPYCRACKVLEPKFKAIASHDRYKNLPLVWAEMGARGSITQTFFQRLGILALPTMLFYDGSNQLVDNFPCAPSKLPVFQKKLTQFLTDHIDPATMDLKSVQQLSDEIADKPRITREILVGNEYVTEEHLNYLKNDLPFFKDLAEEEFFDMLRKAKLQTFDAGDIIIRQGLPGKTFYVIKSGAAEMYVRSKFDSLLSTPSNYLGAVVNELGKFDYFGERSLTSGQPLAASVRALDKVRCFAFDVNDIPESSILSKERRATNELVDQLSRRYELPDDYMYESEVALSQATQANTHNNDNDILLDLLVRFRQIRQATKGFEYILRTDPEFGNKGEAIRRSMLVAKLSKVQRDEFRAVFDMADVRNRGRISLLELKQFMSSSTVPGKQHHLNDDELLEIISRANPAVDGSGKYITLDDFMGVMAEAEFYYMFKDTFRELDKENSGYVKVGDLDAILGGVRDLMSDDRGKSIIHSDDKDILVDYEQFTVMLLGAGL
jgi:calmodulin